MPKSISIIEIQNYLNSYHLHWTGEIFDYSSQCFRMIKHEDIVKNETLLLKLKDDYVFLNLDKQTLSFAYSPDDISTFIADKLKYYWDTKIVDDNYVSRPATAQDFIPHIKYGKLTKKISLPVMNVAKSDSSKSLNVEISNSKFLVETYENIHDNPYFDSYSESWQNFLLNKHPETYAPIFIDILTEECREIESRAVIKKTLFGKKKILSTYDSSILERNRKRLASARRLFDDNYSV